MKQSEIDTLCKQIAISSEQLRCLLDEIERTIPRATVWAFGSRVKGEHRPASDLDLAVHCDKETARKELLKLNERLIESDLPFKVQLLDYNRLPETMQKNISKKYVVLYQPQKEIMKLVSNDTLNRLADELRRILLSEKSRNQDDFQALLEKILRVGDGVKIQIYPRDHNPPHFHVEAGGKSASYDIQSGKLLQGSLGHVANNIVQQFYCQNQTELMNIWNNTRPGIISEGISYMLN